VYPIKKTYISRNCKTGRYKITFNLLPGKSHNFKMFTILVWRGSGFEPETVELSDSSAPPS